jgi:hypothetical protein
MSALDHLRALARGTLPADDGLLGNARCAWGRGVLISGEAILAAFAARPFDVEGDLHEVESPQGAALIGQDGALVADLYGGRIGRLWRVGRGIVHPPEQAVDVAFDPDMRQERGGLSFRAEDHPDLDPAAAEQLLAAAGAVIDLRRSEGKLRVRAFVVRAFGKPGASAALLSLHSLSNDMSRAASFSYAVIGAGPGSSDVRVVSEEAQPRDWTPRI